MVKSKDNLGIEDNFIENKDSKRALNVALLVKIFLTIVVVYYIYLLLFGESSIGVLEDAKNREAKLKDEYHKIQNENQKLQKKHFELIQLTPDEDSF